MQKLKTMGFEKVELLDTTGDLFMTKKEAKLLFFVWFQITGWHKIMCNKQSTD